RSSRSTRRPTSRTTRNTGASSRCARAAGAWPGIRRTASRPPSAATPAWPTPRTASAARRSWRRHWGGRAREGCDMREDVIGRAIAEVPGEPGPSSHQPEGCGGGAFGPVANAIEPWAPKSDSEPLLWRYRDLRPHVLKSVDLVTPEKAGRRVIYLSNPKRRQ